MSKVRAKRSDGVLNRTIFVRDNLEVLRGMESGSVDLVYLDPPFNKNRMFASPLGGAASGACFDDTWSLGDVDASWWSLLRREYPAVYGLIEALGVIGGESRCAYLGYMAVRLVELHRLLRRTGVLYFHCDVVMVHSVKLVLDAIFGVRNFRNEIIWRRAVGGTKGSQFAARKYGDSVDCILFYSKSDAYFFRLPVRVLDKEQLLKKFPKIDEQGRRFRLDRIEASRVQGERPNLRYAFRGYVPATYWLVSREKLARMQAEGRLAWSASSGRPYRKYFADEFAGSRLDNLWTDIGVASGKERTDYRTQKPLALLERIIGSSSREGDWVLDPFCGCATSCVVAEKLGRNWTGIDCSDEVFRLAMARLEREFPFLEGKLIRRDDAPIRREAGGGGCTKEAMIVQRIGVH